MIEIIREENWDGEEERRGLPKNIKQIGTPDVGDRIYIENNAYQKLHPYGQNAEKMVYVMLGRFDDFAGNTCIFIEDIVKMNEVEFNGKLPVWNDESWGYLYRKLKPEHENMIIVGWAVDICGQLPSMTAQLERVHQTYFGGTHQILLLLDTLEREEAFYCNRNGYLKRREGFFVYYDKGIPERMETVMGNMKTEKRISEDNKSENNRTENNSLYEEEVRSRNKQSYRDYLNKQKGIQQASASYKRSYSSTMLLLVVVGALGYSAFQNYEKMQNMEVALNQIDEYQTVMMTNSEKSQSENLELEEPVKVEDIVGNIAPLQEPVEQIVDANTIVSSTQNEQLESMQSENMQENKTEPIPVPSEIPGEPDISVSETQEIIVETISEAETYLAQGFYIVQQGDNLAAICRRIYNTTAMMEQICKVNGIKNPDAIFAGQRLTLPN